MQQKPSKCAGNPQVASAPAHKKQRKIEAMDWLSHPFWGNVEVVEDQDECWLWTGSLDANGYGWYRVPGTNGFAAHRFAYELAKGPIPKPLVMDHLCRVVNCVNPRHLEAVTIAENTRRGMSPAAMAHRENRCYNGHPFTPENTITGTKGNRQCKTCHRAYLRRKYREKRIAQGLPVTEPGHCRNGHLKIPENRTKDGGCRICKNITNNAARLRKSLK